MVGGNGILGIVLWCSGLSCMYLFYMVVICGL